MDDQALCEGNEYLDISEGEVLINEGDAGDAAYCVVTGEVLVWKVSEFGPIELARSGLVPSLERCAWWMRSLAVLRFAHSARHVSSA